MEDKKILFFQFQYDVTIAYSKSANNFQRQSRTRCWFYKTSKKTEAKSFLKDKIVVETNEDLSFTFPPFLTAAEKGAGEEKPKEKKPEVND